MTSRAAALGVVRAPWLPAALVAAVLGLDAVNDRVPFHMFLTGGLDEPAHLATAALALGAAADVDVLRRHGTVVLSALVGSMAIDVDHIPLYAGLPHVAADGRPYSHSLATSAVLLVAAGAVPRGRRVLAGLALGVGLHFVRDIGTGPGLPLWWPFRISDVRVPYPAYVGALVVLAGCATYRSLRWRRSSGQNA